MLVDGTDNTAVWHKIGDGTELFDADFSTNGALERTGAGTYSTRALVATSAGAGDAAKLPILNGSGVLAISFIGDGTMTDAKMATDVKIGSLAALTTSVTTSVVLAINSLVTDIAAVAAAAASAVDLATAVSAIDAIEAVIAAATTNTGGGAGNVGLLVELDGDGKIDGRDVGADGAALDLLAAMDLTTARLVEFPVGIGAPISEAGTWTTGVASSKVKLMRTALAGDADAAWLVCSSIYRAGASDGVTFTGARVHYFVGSAIADDIRFEFYRNTYGADNSAGTSTVVGGDQNAEYDGSHDTGAERGDWPGGGPHFHTATITFPSAVTLLSNEFVTVRIFVDADVGGTTAVTVLGVNLVGSENFASAD